MSKHSAYRGTNRAADASVARRSSYARGRSISYAWIVAAIALALSGCTNLRLPAVDPTGRRIFSPLPTTTTLALPGSAGEGKLGSCFRRLGDPLNLRPFRIPQPAFTEPAEPPACLVPQTAAPPLATAPAVTDEPCVPGCPCPGECKDGPPAVLLGNECNMRDLCRLPRRGKRGCILLSPQKIVAPVGGEVVLLSGICGTDGYLQVGEPLEWMLTPESVGTFIEVGDDDPGLLHKLARVKKANKEDPQFAKGVTSTKRTLITRGNLNPNDDVQLEKGQTWITVSSPSEGTSKVTVLAPDSECWDQRKSTATIYWVDARWQYPSTQIVPAGTPVDLTTRVTRSEGSLPARGWKVRYEILQPELASFAGTNGSSFVEATVDDAGNATVGLVPVPGTAGTAAIAMQIIRPGGERDNLPTLTLSQGETFVTWSAPQLSLRAGAPQVAPFGQTVQAVANVSNPGDQPAENVRVELRLPEGIRASSPDAFAQNLTSSIVWDLGTIPPKTELDLFVNLVTENPMRLKFEAFGSGNLYATDTIAIDVYRPSIALSVTPERERYEVGEAITYNIDVRNTGERPLENLMLVADGGEGILHESNQQSVRKPKEDGDLNPGQTWKVAVTFIPTDAGRRCIRVQATADTQQQAQADACVTVINKAPPTPAITATLTGRSRISVGEVALFRSIVSNSGQVPLSNVVVSIAYDPQLTPVAGTEEFLNDPIPGQYQLKWTIPQLAPGDSTILEAELQGNAPNPRSTMVLAIESDQGAREGKQIEFEISPPAINQPDRPPAPESALPPATAPPTIPQGPAPIQNPRQPDTTPNVPNVPSEPLALGLNLAGPSIPVRAKEPIRYTLRVTNPASTPDSSVSIRFNFPPGITVNRISRTLDPEAIQFQVREGFVYLPDIRSMRPQETIEFEILLISNQPQTFDLQAEAVSAERPRGARSTVRTQVVQ